MYRTFADLGVWPPSAVVKVDDTIPGIDEGNQAGCWTVGVSVSGNFVGLSEAEWINLDPDVRSTLRLAANEKLLKAGAHFVVDSVADLIPVIDEIETLLAQGVLP